MPADERHTAPCAWNRATMWLIGILLVVCGLAISVASARIAQVEIVANRAAERADDARGTLIRAQADIEYIRAAVTEIRQDVRSARQ
jgi:hypothetical protein